MDNWTALERKYCESWEKPEDTMYMASLFDKNRAAAASIRKRYLNSVIELHEQYDSDISNFWLNEARSEIEKLEAQSAYTPIKGSGNGIDESMIDTARNHPITKVVDFNGGKALAFCHEDSKPSLHYWKEKNFAYCFVCNRRFDAIAVLMERDGYSFVDSVRALCE